MALAYALNFAPNSSGVTIPNLPQCGDWEIEFQADLSNPDDYTALTNLWHTVLKNTTTQNGQLNLFSKYGNNESANTSVLHSVEPNALSADVILRMTCETSGVNTSGYTIRVFLDDVEVLVGVNTSSNGYVTDTSRPSPSSRENFSIGREWGETREIFSFRGTMEYFKFRGTDINSVEHEFELRNLEGESATQWTDVLSNTYHGILGAAVTVDTWNEYTYTTGGTDTTAPIITVTEGNLTITEGDAVPTFSASTDDGSAITQTGNADTNTPAVYPYTFNAIDAAGNLAAEVTRTITVEAAVVATDSTLSMSLTNIPDGTYTTRVIRISTSAVVFSGDIAWASGSASQLITDVVPAVDVEYYVIGSTEGGLNRGTTA